MSDVGDSCFPSLATIQRQTGRRRAVITKALTELEDAGYLIVQRPETLGRGHVNHYRAATPNGSDGEPFRAADPTKENGSRPTEKRSASTQQTVPLDATNGSGGGSGGRKAFEGVKREKTYNPEGVKIAAKPQTPHQALMAVFAEVMGRNPQGGEGGRWGKAATAMVKQGIEPEEFRLRAAIYRHEWSDMEFNPNAVWSNWGRMDPEFVRRNGLSKSPGMRTLMEAEQLRREGR